MFLDFWIFENGRRRQIAPVEICQVLFGGMTELCQLLLTCILQYFWTSCNLVLTNIPWTALSGVIFTDGVLFIDASALLRQYVISNNCQMENKSEIRTMKLASSDQTIWSNEDQCASWPVLQGFMLENSLIKLYYFAFGRQLQQNQRERKVAVSPPPRFDWKMKCKYVIRRIAWILAGNSVLVIW